MSDGIHTLFEGRGAENSGGHSTSAKPLKFSTGVLSSQRIDALITRKRIHAIDPITQDQLQPASLDLRLGHSAFRVRASFLTGKKRTVKELLDEVALDEISLKNGAVLERGCVYVVQLQEFVDLPESITAIANPKSSTGRLDVFTRLISDNSDVFDSLTARYKGPLFAEISPRTFPVKVRTGSRLNQLRFRSRSSSQVDYADFVIPDKELEKLHKLTPLVDGTATIRRGLHLSVQLRGTGNSRLIGYRAQRYTDIIDIDEPQSCLVQDYWDKIYARREGRLILDPDHFYILASKEALHIPPNLAAEMVPIDPTMGEFRVHYAGFFDPGFGHSAAGGQGSRAVLEVRSHEVPFILEDGQTIGRLVYERLTETPEEIYGSGIGSHYQAQGLKLSKHFK
jgi:dCTP deaminase